MRSRDNKKKLSGGSLPLDLGEVELEDWEDVDDPAGLETDAYLACAEEVHRLVTKIDDRL